MAFANSQANPTHSAIYCTTAEHIDRFPDVNYNYSYGSAHIESGQTGLAHHHHSPH